MLPEILFTNSICHSWSYNLFEDCLIFSGRSELVFSPPVGHTELAVEWFSPRLGKTDGADVLLQLEGRAHKQQGEVVVVIAGVKVGVLLEILKVNGNHQGCIASPGSC